MSNTVTTGKVRFSYAHIFTPTKSLGSDVEKYSLSVIIPKSDKATLNKVKAAIEEATKTGAASKWGGKLPNNLRTPLRDGDAERPDDPAYKDSFFFNCKSNTRPGIVDADLNEILNPTEVYSGCYGRVNVSFFPYDSNGSRGVAVGLNHVQKLEDGEPLGGSAPSVQAAFGDDLLD